MGLVCKVVFHAEEDLGGWSLPIRDSKTGNAIDASREDWRKPLTMQTVSQEYHLGLPSQQVRIFISGAREGISGLVETSVMPRGHPFYLCYPVNLWPRLEQWATTQCIEFKNLAIVKGLPDSWRLASIEEGR